MVTQAGDVRLVPLNQDAGGAGVGLRKDGRDDGGHERARKKMDRKMEKGKPGGLGGAGGFETAAPGDGAEVGCMRRIFASILVVDSVIL